jgi:hypothetical protein
MSRSVPAAVVVAALTIAAAVYLRPVNGAEDSGRERHEQLLQRLDELESRVIAVAAIRVSPTTTRERPTSTEAVAPSPVATPQRDEVRRAANEIVDRGLVSARWSRLDMIQLGIATAGLDEVERTEIYSRVAMAINEDRLRLDSDTAGP